jgi:uncharacterized protein YkwD
MAKKPLFKENSGQHVSLIKPNTIGLLLVFFLAVKVLIALAIPQSSVLQASDLTADNILNGINQQRSLRDLVTLNTNGMLTWAAQSKADDMQARHYFAHVDPDGHYIWDKIVAAGYTPYLELGENIAIEFYDTDSLISAWMNSPEHRANILNDGFKDQGMGLNFGDTTIGQYHSVIDNTFGALAPVPKVSVPASNAQAVPKSVTAAPKPVATPKPKTLGTQKTAPASPTMPQTPSPATVTTTPPLNQPILTRAEEELAQNNPQSNFSLGQPAVATSSSSTKTSISKKSAPPVVGSLNNPTLTSYQENRYLVLFAGLILLLFMLSDIRKNVQNKFSHLDKKFNNLIVLIISLVVIAFMYWL